MAAVCSNGLPLCFSDFLNSASFWTKLSLAIQMVQCNISDVASDGDPPPRETWGRCRKVSALFSCVRPGAAPTGCAMTDALLHSTPLHPLHLELGAKMAGFAGYALPLHYTPGILAEHLHTRAAVSLFDVSHMGQIVLTPPDAAALALESLVPADIVGVGAGRQRYALLMNDSGGIIDDLMVAYLPDRLALMVNAGGKADDFAHLRGHLPAEIMVTPRFDRALLALQGPGAEVALAPLCPAAPFMRFMDAIDTEVAGVSATITRSGYTGEDGWEIGVEAVDAIAVARALLAQPGVLPAGLGARDSLRLEAGLCLYGHELDPTTTPVEAALEWSIQRARRSGSARAGGYPGTGIVARQLADGPPRRRVGLRPEGRAPVRAPAPLFADEKGGEPVGNVTSGGFGPTVGAPVAMAYVASHHSTSGTMLWADVRGRRLASTVCPLPFVPARLKR